MISYSSSGILHSPTMRVLLSHALGTFVHLRLPSPGYWCLEVYLFFLSGRSRLPTRTRSCFSIFAKSTLRRANTFSLRSLRSVPRISLSSSVYLISPRFRAQTFPLFLPFLLPLPCTYLPNFSVRISSSLLGFFPYPSILYPLCYPTIFQLSLWLLSPIIQIYQLWLETSSLVCFLLYVAISTFSCLYFCLEWVNSQFYYFIPSTVHYSSYLSIPVFSWLLQH